MASFKAPSNNQDIRHQKSTSYTTLADGTKITTTEVIMTNPKTNTQVETTTQVKEYQNTTTLTNGSLLVEDVTVTTITKKESSIITAPAALKTTGLTSCPPNESTTFNLDVFRCNPCSNTDGNSNEDCATVDGATIDEATIDEATLDGTTVENDSVSEDPSVTLDSAESPKESSSKIRSDQVVVEAKSSRFGYSRMPSLSTTFFQKTNLANSKATNKAAPQSVDSGRSSSEKTKQSTEHPIAKSSSSSSSLSHTNDESKHKPRVKFTLDSEIINIMKKDKKGSSDMNIVKPEKEDLYLQPNRESTNSFSPGKEERDDTGSLMQCEANRVSLSSCRDIVEEVVSTNKAQEKFDPKPSSKKKSSIKPEIVKYTQKLLPYDADFASPKVAIDGDNAAVTDDKYLHFFSFKASTPSSLPPTAPSKNDAKSINVSGKWRKTTTVTIENTYCMSVSIYGNTAIVGVPYDRNVRGLLTGAAYIFEKDIDKDVWIQVKKIVPKEVSEFATVGYSIGIHGDLICVSVPNVGSTVGGGLGGSVHVYRRVLKYKWMEKGILVPPDIASDGGIIAGNNPVRVTLMNKPKVSCKKKFGSLLAVQGNVVLVSDHFEHEQTTVYVYEYDEYSHVWNCIQDNLLSKAQQEHFGSRLALTNNGNGILIGCHAKMNPTEVLYYSRYGMGGKYHLQQVIVVSKRTSSYPSVGRNAVGRGVVTEDVTDFQVNGKVLILGTTSSIGQKYQQCVYIYQLQTNDTWILMAKVDDPSMVKFGQSVGLAGKRALIASKSNAYSYNLEDLIPKSKRKIFMSAAQLLEEKPKQQLTYNESDYLQLPYVGSGLQDFRSRQQVMLLKNFSTTQKSAPSSQASSPNVNNEEKSVQNSTSSPMQHSIGIARPKMTKMLRMRSPSPMMRRIKTASPLKSRN